MGHWRFGIPTDFGAPLEGSYQLILVALSVLVMGLAAFAALSVVQRLQASAPGPARAAWLSLGSLAMGSGVWAMHFTGMLAFKLPVAMSFSATFTLLSVVPAIAGSAAGLRIMSRQSVEWWRMQVGGLCLALGIGAMHYFGMEAMTVDAALRYDPFLFVLSIVVAHVLATTALFVRFRLVDQDVTNTRFKVAAATLMGLAVSGMHYTAMAAARFYAVPVSIEPTMIMPPNVLALTIIVLVSAFLGLTVISTIVDRRLADANDTAMRSGMRYRAFVDSMADGLVTVNGDGQIEQMNPAAENMLGCRAENVIGASVDGLFALPPVITHGHVASRFVKYAEMASFETIAHHRRADAFPVELKVNETTTDSGMVYGIVVRDITKRKADEAERQRLVTALDSAQESILVTDRDGRIQYVNPAFVSMTQLERSEVIGQYPRVNEAAEDAEKAKDVWRTLCGNEVWTGTLRYLCKDQIIRETESSISPVRTVDGLVDNYVAVSRDVSAQRTLEDELAQARKLESIGQLAAGIAHEINTPTQYVADNTRFLEEAFSSITTLTKTLVDVVDVARTERLDEARLAQVDKAIRDADLDYFIEEIPRAIAQSLEGIGRVTKIVGAMKEFSHPSVEKTLTDLNRAIESTITVATNEWKYVADVETDFDPNLPSVPCIPGEFNQVVLNMVVNAAHAIEERKAQDAAAPDRGTITVSTRQTDDSVEVVIGDTGTGMPEEIIERIFDPFFTTKTVGKGTGQGLSLAHSAIVKKLGGTLDVESKVGVGSKFKIKIPLTESEARSSAA